MSVSYWHGGIAGLHVGDFIESSLSRLRRRQQTPLERTRQMTYAVGHGHKVYDRNRVYFTTDPELARTFALGSTLSSSGALYRVRPVPPSSLEVDPDFPDCGFSARRAEVIEVTEPRVEMSEETARRISSKYVKWSDDSPMYDDEGYLLPPPEHREVGKTPADYRHFGRWFPLIGTLRLEPTGEIWAVQPSLDRTPPRWE